MIEALPLPDAAVNVVISNSVIGLSTDKPAALADMFRVLVPDGRIGITDVVAEDQLSGRHPQLPAQAHIRAHYAFIGKGGSTRNYQSRIGDLAAAEANRVVDQVPRADINEGE